MKSVKMYTIQDVARILRVNQNMIIGLIKQRKLKANKVGKVYRISKMGLKNYLQKSKPITVPEYRFSTAGSILKYAGTWAVPKEEYEIILKAIKDADTEAEF